MAGVLVQVAVKCRPFKERERGRDIVKVIDNKVWFSSFFRLVICGVLSGFGDVCLDFWGVGGACVGS